MSVFGIIRQCTIVKRIHWTVSDDEYALSIAFQFTIESEPLKPGSQY